MAVTPSEARGFANGKGSASTGAAEFGLTSLMDAVGHWFGWRVQPIWLAFSRR
ncbi:hypothetical protein [Reyranella sp.]|uniref:hypothetical protein n=1 Tax=Reyranella sp. TaxID=1929291 RepID=UPI003BAA275E